MSFYDWSLHDGTMAVYLHRYQNQRQNQVKERSRSSFVMQNVPESLQEITITPLAYAVKATVNTLYLL